MIDGGWWRLIRRIKNQPCFSKPIAKSTLTAATTEALWLIFGLGRRRRDGKVELKNSGNLIGQWSIHTCIGATNTSVIEAVKS